MISGTLTLAGSTRPVRLQVSQTGPDHYHATTSVRQSDFGIKPYTAFLGALRVRDAVGSSRSTVGWPDGAEPACTGMTAGPALR